MFVIRKYSGMLDPGYCLFLRYLKYILNITGNKQPFADVLRNRCFKYFALFAGNHLC